MAQEKMSPQMIQFMTEFADLLEKHGVELNGREGHAAYSTWMDGIDIDQDGIYKDGDTDRPWVSVEMGGFINAEVIRNTIAKNSG